MLLFPASNDLLTMFVALEVLSLPLYLLCGLARRRRLLSQEAAMKYFLLGAFSSGFFVYGIALIYGYAGSMGFAEIAEAVAGQAGSQALLLGGIALLAVGLLFKVGAAPFHAWTPDVYQGAPTAVTAFMAASTKVAAFGALLRLFYVAFGGDRTDWTPMIWIVAILTMVVGSVLALTQTDIKRMLAYSSIAHAGFILTGFLGIRSLGRRRRRQPHRRLGGAVLPDHLRVHDPGGVRARDRRTRRRRGGHAPVALAGPGQGVAARGRAVRVPAARHGRHPADQRVHRQVGRLRGRAVGRRVAGGDRGGADVGASRRTSTSA